MIKSAQDVTEEQGMGFAVPAQLEGMMGRNEMVSYLHHH